MQPGDEVFFWVRSSVPISLRPRLQLTGRVLKVNPDGTVTCRSASGLITETVPAKDVELADPTSLGPQRGA